MNDTIIIHTQKEFDKIKDNFNGRIEIKDTKEYISINKGFKDGYIFVSGNATIESVYDNATIKYVSGNATIKSVYDNATILLMAGLASIVLLYGAKKIIAKGMNLIRQIGTSKIDIEMSKSVIFIQIKENIEKTPTFDLYSKLYPVEVKSKKAILFKSVHKVNGEYISDKDNNFKYIIGEVKKENCDESKENSCSYGIHLSNLQWAINFGKEWSDRAILECECDIKDIVVSRDCDGKVRTSKCKILRELNKDEY
jgi:hypothetical protein